MQKLYLGSFVLLIVLASCGSGKNNSKAEAPNAVISQGISNDTLVTYYYGVQPYKLNQHINTQIKFVRNVNDTAGRFYLTEVYANRKDSVLQRYDGTGNYKILP